jgi:hypothetical protein
MEFTDQRNIGLDEQTDSVTAWIRMLAIGMVALGVLFIALDRYHFFDHFPERQQSPQVAS